MKFLCVFLLYSAIILATLDSVFSSGYFTASEVSGSYGMETSFEMKYILNDEGSENSNLEVSFKSVHQDQETNFISLDFSSPLKSGSIRIEIEFSPDSKINIFDVKWILDVPSYYDIVDESRVLSNEISSRGNVFVASLKIPKDKVLTDVIFYFGKEMTEFSIIRIEIFVDGKEVKFKNVDFH